MGLNFTYNNRSENKFWDSCCSRKKQLLNGNHDKYSVDIHCSKITVSILILIYKLRKEHLDFFSFYQYLFLKWSDRVSKKLYKITWHFVFRLLSVPTGNPRLAMKQPTPHPTKIEDDLESPTDTWGRNFKVRHLTIHVNSLMKRPLY